MGVCSELVDDHSHDFMSRTGGDHRDGRTQGPLHLPHEFSFQLLLGFLVRGQVSVDELPVMNERPEQTHVGFPANRFVQQAPSHVLLTSSGPGFHDVVVKSGVGCPGAAVLVYVLVLLTFRTPFLEQSVLKRHSRYIALFAGLLFVSHPVQTEAVTYIFQRLASLGAFLYLLSLTAYISSRLSTGTIKKYVFFTVSESIPLLVEIL